MLLNNLHALRVHTQGLFEDMGGEEVSHYVVYTSRICGIYLLYMATCIHGIVQRYIYMCHVPEKDGHDINDVRIT